MTASRFVPAILATVVSFALLGSTSVAGQTSRTRTTYTGTAVNLNELINLPQQTPITIDLDRWSDDGEREQFLTALGDDGVAGLVDMLQKTARVGSIRTPNQPALEFHFGMVSEGQDGGQQITLVTERSVGFAEAIEGGRTLEYRFVVLQLSINPIGRGTGRLSIATRVTRDRVTGELQLESWQNSYVNIRDLRKTTR